MTSDAGVMLLGVADRQLGLIDAAARCIADPRNPLLIKHDIVDMLRQRVYGLALGWEDLKRLRQRWPAVRVVFRGDSGFCRQRIINYCERADVQYITTCQQFQSNQLGMLLVALGYMLIERLRALALVGTALATGQVDTLRIKLLKVAAVGLRATRGAFACTWPPIGPVRTSLRTP